MDALTAMRRYAFGFVNSHDFAVCRQIITPDYELHYGADLVQGRDENYIPAVANQIKQFPNLGYAIHEMISDGEWTGVLFSEHGASAKDPSREASWLGVGLYRFNGEQLSEAWVEQDHYSRRKQLASNESVTLPPVSVDPWTHAVKPAEPGVADALHAWWKDQHSWPPKDPACVVDPSDYGAEQPKIAVSGVTIDRLVVSGDRVAFHATVSGRYQGGIPGFSGTDQPVDHYLGGFSTVRNGTVSRIVMVTHRIGVQRQLKAAQSAI